MCIYFSKGTDEWDAEADINGHRVSLRDIGDGKMRGNDGKEYRKGPGGTIQEESY